MTLARRLPALLATLTVALLLLAAPPARAHSQLVSSTPADGSTLATVPPTATLTFNEEIHPTFVQVVVAGPDGAARPVQASAAGAVVTAPLPTDLGTGRVAVRYRVVSKDGHPISGEVGFTVGGGTGTPPATTAPATQTDAATSAPSPAGQSTAAGGAPVLPYVVGAVAALALLGGGWALLRRGRD